MVHCGFHHISRINTAQSEEQLRVMVKARANSVEGCGYMLAHARPVRAGAAERDLTGGWKEPLAFAGHDGHHAFGDGALKQLDQRANLACALAFDLGPVIFFKLCDGDFYLVDRGAAYERVDLSCLNLQVDDRAVAHIGAPAWHSVGVVAVCFKVITPGFAPEGRGDFATSDFDG